MLKFWNSNKVKDLPKALSEELAWHYSLTKDFLKGLRYASRAGSFVGKKTTYVRIFDPALLVNGVSLIRRYDDLTDQTDAVLFEGRVAGDRIVELFDRRPTV